MNLPIRVRLTAWYASLLATTTFALGTFIVLQLRADLRAEIDDEARTSSWAIAQAMGDDGDPSDADRATDRAEVREDFADVAQTALPPAHEPSAAQVLTTRGAVLAQYGTVAGGEPLVGAAQRSAALAGESAIVTVRLGEERQRYRVKVTPYRDGNAERLLVVAVSLERVEDAVDKLVVLLLIAGPAAIVATALAAYWLANKALRPIGRMTRDAEEIGIGRLQERVAVPASHDEMRRLAVTLNAMLDRIEKGADQQRRLIADASHELRTPLAVMRTEIDVSLRGDELSQAAREVLGSAREEVDHMSRTVDNLLTLAAVDEGRLELLTVPLELRAAAEEAAARLRTVAAARSVRLEVTGDRWEAQADPQRLQLALTNLLDNAIKFSPDGGIVRVFSWRGGGEVGITVTDEGPGVGARDHAHLFDRFYRADGARGSRIGGSGLGLAICREVAVAHGGRAWVESELTRGSAFSFALPSWRALAEDTASGHAQSWPSRASSASSRLPA